MTGFATWWRKAGGMLAAVVLAVMVFGPVTEASACVDASTAAAAVLDQAGDALASDGRIDRGPCDDGACPCEHCQCHHAGAYAPITLSEVQGPRAERERHVPAEGPSPASSLTFGFKRPPRG